jgi:hypothetical protein
VSRLRARIQRQELEAMQWRIVAEALRADPGLELRNGKLKRAGARAAAGDGARLRGLPCIARGVSGAIRGTAPGNAASLSRAERDLRRKGRL